jgi:NAD(P)-dependent dehydrogenase (short-subunit alcohol dehydrogenase family)
LEYFDDIAGKTVIITGGSKGIGKGCAQVFCEAKANVIICARGEKEGIELAKELNKNTDGTCVFFQCDVSYPEQIKSLIEFTVKEFGNIDCLINNCGYLPKRRPLDEIEVEDFEHVLKTNLISMFISCKHALPYIRKSKGTIINMSSIIGITGQEGSVMYTSIKAAIITFTKSLAIDEARHGIRVNVVVPGHIETEMYELEKSRAADPSKYEKLCNQSQWLGRGGTSIEVGYSCLYLASKLSSFITGAELFITGGFELGNGPKIPFYNWKTEKGI